jgi:SAM-dependent methyltransferase
MKSVAESKRAAPALSTNQLNGQPILVRTAEWNHFAQEDAYTYIMTNLRRGDHEAFWRSGEAAVAQELLPVLREQDVPSGTALEIGCGVGRLMFPISHYFGQVMGVDISFEMVRQGRALAAERAIANVQFFSVDQPARLAVELSEFAGKIDFVYSLLVFQHIDSFPVIQGYLQSLGSLLSDKGVAYLQFDTRKRDWTYQVKTAMPDVALPRFWRRGIRRIRRTTAELEGCFLREGFQIARSIAPHTDYHRYILRKPRP